MSYLKLHSEYACFNRWLSVKQHSYFSTTRIRLKLGVKVVHTQANASRGAVSCTKQTICSCCLLCFKVQHHRVQFKIKHVIRRPFKAYPNNTGIIKKEVKPLSANETRKWWTWQLTNQNNFDYYNYILEKCKALTTATWTLSGIWKEKMISQQSCIIVENILLFFQLLMSEIHSSFIFKGAKTSQGVFRGKINKNTARNQRDITGIWRTWV